VSNVILTTNIKYSTQSYTGVWISKSPDHNLIVMDMEGLARHDLSPAKVERGDICVLVNMRIQV
jgi:hypothetical protein